jgi:succinate-semialdehyde dehydrogenase/glutarate-semialdehyde dehydrogenase
MKMIIDGKGVDASNGAVIEVTNPANGKVIDTVPAATEEDVVLAVEKAKQGQKKWAQVPVHEKGDILLMFVALVEENKEKLARTLSDETGKPITEARGEIANIPIAFKGFVEKAKRLYGEAIPQGQEKNQEHHVSLTLKEPIGVVACVIPFNFPCDLFDQKVAPTLPPVTRPLSNLPPTIP